MAEARKQANGAYRPEYGASPVISYIRQGFGLEGSSPPSPRRGRRSSPRTSGPGDSDQIVTVTYRSPAGVDNASLGSDDLTVTGPGRQRADAGGLVRQRDAGRERRRHRASTA
jgi:hypothetical protein